MATTTASRGGDTTMFDDLMYLQDLEMRLHEIRTLESKLPQELRGALRDQRRVLEQEILYRRVAMRDLAIA